MNKVQVLDHGYLSLVETWGSDERIIEAARMSTNKGFLGWEKHQRCRHCNTLRDGREYTEREDCPRGVPSDPKQDHEWVDLPGDEKLLRFLWENKHATPFEMAGLTIEVKAPIMVFREWHRHRVPFGYNEVSARYVPLPNENYCPTVERIVEGARSAGKNKQAQGVGDKVPTEEEVQIWLINLASSYELAQIVYEQGLALGVPKELARLPVPVARYSRMRATGNLRGWFGFMALRSAPGAQWEIRQYAAELGRVIEASFPRTWALFAEGRS